jgi:hypothetical protein
MSRAEEAGARPGAHLVDDLVDALRLAIGSGDGAAIAMRCARGATLESYTSGVRRTAYGRDGVVAAWRRVVGGGGVITHWTVSVADGGVEVDAQTRTAAGRPARRVHRLHVDAAGDVHWHVVFPAAPYDEAPDALPAGLPVAPGSVRPLRHGGFSGAALYAATSVDGEPLLVKHIRPRVDWMSVATADPGREARLLTDGVYAALPPTLRCPVIAAERVADGWIVVMTDVDEGHRALAGGAGVDAAGLLLPALRDTHERFAGVRPTDALCGLAERLGLFSPVRPLVERHGDDLLPKTLIPMWDTFAERGDPDVVRAVLTTVAEPRRLLHALAEQPHTLLHGDYQHTNLALGDDGAVVALDWGLAAWGPAELDYVWFLSNTAWGDDASRERVERLWTDLTGVARDARVADLAVAFHAAMGEVAFLVTEPVYALAGQPAPSAQTVAWWQQRTREAYARLGWLVG